MIVYAKNILLLDPLFLERGKGCSIVADGMNRTHFKASSLFLQVNFRVNCFFYFFSFHKFSLKRKLVNIFEIRVELLNGCLVFINNI